MPPKEDWILFFCSGAEHLQEAFFKAGYMAYKSQTNYDGSRRFSNSDIYTRFAEIESAAGKRVAVIQSFTCSGEGSENRFTTSDRLMETLQVIDCLKMPRSVKHISENKRDYTELEKPREIAVVALHLPFSKQDQLYNTGESNTNHLALRMLFSEGADRIVTIDPHVPRDFTWVQQYYESGKLISLSMYEYAINQIQSRKQELMESMLLSTPGKTRTHLGAELRLVDKERISTHEVILQGEIDSSMQGKTVFLLDDLVISGTTMKRVRKFLLSKGVADVYAWITHALPYEGGKEENLRRLVDAFDEKIFVSDTIRSRTFQYDFPHCVISCVPMLIKEFFEND